MLKAINCCLSWVLFTFCLNLHAQSSVELLHFASIAQLSEQEVALKVLPQIYQRLGQEITITPLPANRAQYEANSGKKDGEILRIYSYGEQNNNVIRVPTPYYSLTTGVFSRNDRKIIVNSHSDLSKYRIGKVRGVKHTENATKGLMRVYNSKNSEQLFKQLQQGTIDIALTNYLNGELTIKQLNLNNIVAVNKALDHEPLYHYLNKKHQQLVPQVDEAIKQLSASGELAQIIKKAEKDVY